MFFAELDSQLQPISNGGRTKQKRPNKRGQTNSSGWSMIQSFDIVHILVSIVCASAEYSVYSADIF